MSLATISAIFGILAVILPPLLTWFFSGSKTTIITRTPGLEGLDRDTLTGKRDIMDFLPKLVVVICFLTIAGCGARGALVNVGGSNETIRVVIVEPGDTVEIIDERELEVAVQVPDPSNPGNTMAKIAHKKLTGSVSMPKSVYRMLRAKAFPEEAAKEAVKGKG